MKDGFYSVSFSTPLATNTGVVYLTGGKVYGGDNLTFYVGSFTLDGDNLTADIRSDQHQPGAVMGTAFGKAKVSVQLTGKFDASGGAKLTGSSPDAPGVQITGLLVKLPT